METKFTNGHDRENIEPDNPVSEPQIQKSVPTFTLDDLATEEDDLTIIGDDILKHVEVRKPRQQEFFRCHPTWKLSTRAVIDKRGAREVYYLLHKKLMPWSESLEQDSVPVLVVVCINLKGRIFLWVIRKSKDDGDPSKLYATALEHVQAATGDWIRRFWLEDERIHVKRVAQIPDKPAWPSGVTFQDIVIAGFGSRVIMDENAQILRELRGEGPMPRELRDFSEIWFYDFEYKTPVGDPVIPHCLVAHELCSGKRVRLWRDQLQVPPYRLDQDCLYVSYNAAAELSCHLALGWPLPPSILDLSAEFRCQTNGLILPDGLSLLGAMSYYKLDSISVVEKKEMRALAMRGGPFTEKEKKICSSIARLTL